MFQPASTIEEVIARMEAIATELETAGNPHVVFTLVYLGVTRGVKASIGARRFEDGPRMGRFDVAFANRYLEAYHSFQQRQPLTQSWRRCFEAAARPELLHLQHLLLGMNAHINLDLGVAAAEIFPPTELPGMERDFFEINKLLLESIETLQDRLSAVSPLLFLVDWFGKKRDERIAGFSLAKARAIAWKAAQQLSALSPAERRHEIEQLDEYVGVLAKLTASPGMFLSGLLRVVRWWEVKEVRRVVQALSK